MKIYDENNAKKKAKQVIDEVSPANDVKLTTSDVKLTTSDVKLTTSDVKKNDTEPKVVNHTVNFD